jgi:hypothetical protein
MNVVTFLTHHPRRWASMQHVPVSERDFVWDCSVKLLEQYNMMLSNPFLERFYWHAPYFQQWQAFIYVLDTLRAEPLAPRTSQTWKLVGSIFENTPYLMLDMRKPIHVAISNLCLKAYDAREKAFLGGRAPPSPTPAFIGQLRKQREMAVAKQQARKDRQRSLRGPCPDRVSQARGANVDPTTRAHPYQMETNQPEPHQTQPIAENNLLHYFGFSENQNAVHGGTVMDFDFTYPEEYHLEDTPSYDAIDWEQWDSWLAESNLLPSS